METIQSKYTQLCHTPSDINQHLPTLYQYAKECTKILETGVRGCVTSWALAYGLLQNENPIGKRYMLLNDIKECDIAEFLQSTQNLDIQIEYQWVNNLDLTIYQTVDMTFIDTWHVYGQLKRELAKFAPITKKYIIMHDTTVDEIEGETFRISAELNLKGGSLSDKLAWNADEQSIITGIPVEEINCGLGKAIEEFLQENTDWVLKDKFTNNNGLTILSRIRPNA